MWGTAGVGDADGTQGCGDCALPGSVWLAGLLFLPTYTPPNVMYLYEGALIMLCQGHLHQGCSSSPSHAAWALVQCRGKAPKYDDGATAAWLYIP